MGDKIKEFVALILIVSGGMTLVCLFYVVMTFCLRLTIPSFTADKHEEAMQIPAESKHIELLYREEPYQALCIDGYKYIMNYKAGNSITPLFENSPWGVTRISPCVPNDYNPLEGK